MTKEQFDKATDLMDEIARCRTARDGIRHQIKMREYHMSKASPQSTLFDWMKKQFARFSISEEKASLTVRYEGAHPVEFQIDEEFVNMVLDHLDKKVTIKTAELESL